MRPLRMIVMLWLASLPLLGCAVLSPLPAPTGTEERLAAMPRDRLPLQRPVSIHWTERQVPFIEAESDTDLAFALGLVHAHLRLAQMEILRRIAYGRVAELGGPLLADLDHSLRILDIPKAAPAIVAAMPPDSRTFLDAFVAGINHYQSRLPTLPHEFVVGGIEPEPWKADHVIALGRLAAVDINWLVWFRMLPARDRPDWPQLWQRLVTAGSSSAPSFLVPPDRRSATLENALLPVGRTGSNSIAVAAGRSAGGAALMANDPHLGIQLPNLWLLAGFKSPGYHAVGLMVPGLPFVAVGRNPWIAWGGTNMRAASSDLFDAAALQPEQITTRRDRVKVRWWFDREIEIRDTPLGPMVSDAPAVPARDGERLALRWIGHRPTDELSAMLKVNRARNFDEFRAAFDGFAISALNMLYADAAGNIGQVTATQLPARENRLPDDIVRPAKEAAAWGRIVTARELPVAYNPADGFLASANNKAAETEVPLGWFFSGDDRINRMRDLLNGDGKISLDDLRRMQRDTAKLSAIKLRDGLLRFTEGQELSPVQQRTLADIRSWDGHYDANSRAALAFEGMTYPLVLAVYGAGGFQAIEAGGRPYELLLEDLEKLAPGTRTTHLRNALDQATKVVERFGSWGEMHRLQLQHALGQAPLIGGRYRFGDIAADGSNDTLNKTAHALTDQRHDTRYGTNARHISDLSDPDANWFVLLGGQDGWLNSSTFLDQARDLWASGGYVQMPLTPAAARARSRHQMTLSP
jgi:penicillin amidase